MMRRSMQDQVNDHRPVTPALALSPSQPRIPRWVRVGIACALVALPLLIVCTNEDLDERVAYLFQSWSIWSAIGFFAMQGPGQWRSTIGSAMFLVAMTVVSVALFRSYRPTSFVSWDTFWSIDVWAGGFELVKGWCILRLLSMLTGLEIVSPLGRVGPRWSLLRWFYLMLVIAVFLQTSLLEMNWYAELTKDIAGDSMAGPLPVSSATLSRQAWWLVQAATSLNVPWFPVLCAAWMFAGRRWRWAFFPVFLGLCIAWIYASDTAFEAARGQAQWLRNLLPRADRNPWFVGTVSWFAYCFSAILVRWVGFTWTDYWSCPRPTKAPEPSS